MELAQGGNMLHEIAPHRFDNEFKVVTPKDTDVVMYFEDNQVALIEREEGFRLPTLSKFNKYNLLESFDLEYLFKVDEQVYFLIIDTKLMIEQPFALHKLDIFRELSPQYEAFAGITASQIFRFYRDNTFCGRCQSKMVRSKVERAVVCPHCNHVLYPKISPAVIVAITDGNRILMTRYARGAYKKYALVAGYVEIGESFEEAVHREVMEEVGLKIKNLRYYKSQPWAFSDSMMVGYFAELDGDDTVTLQESELAEATWFEREDIPENSSTLSISQELVRCVREGKF
jgi:NAD+ diphosphatase